MAVSNTYITDLSAELLLEIFESVQSSSPASLLNLSLVSERFHALALDVLFRTLNLEFSVSRLQTNQRLFRILLDPVLSGKVHHINVAEFIDAKRLFSRNSLMGPVEALQYNYNVSHYKSQFNKQSQSLSYLLTKLHSLQSFRWNIDGNIPESVLNSLHLFHPYCRLDMPRKPCTQLRDETVQNLLNSPGLTSLGARLYRGEVLSFLRDVKNTWSNCPRRVKKLILKDQSGSRSNESIGALKDSLSLQLEELELRKFCVNPGDEETWKSAIEWSCLKILSTNDTSFLPVIQSQMSSLRSLTISMETEHQVERDYDLWIEQLKTFIKNCHALEEIRLDKLPNIIDCEIAAHLGPSLKSIYLACSAYPVNVRMVTLLGQHCFKLRNLVFKIVYSGIWPPPALAAIANNFHFINHLTLVIHVAIPNSQIESKPKCRLPIARIWSYLWKTMCAAKAESQAKSPCPQSAPPTPTASLQTLTFPTSNLIQLPCHCADSTPNRYRYALNLDHQRPRNMPSVRDLRNCAPRHDEIAVRRSDRDDEALFGISYIRCKTFEQSRVMKEEFNIDFQDRFCYPNIVYRGRYGCVIGAKKGEEVERVVPRDVDDGEPLYRIPRQSRMEEYFQPLQR